MGNHKVLALVSVAVTSCLIIARAGAPVAEPNKREYEIDPNWLPKLNDTAFLLSDDHGPMYVCTDPSQLDDWVRAVESRDKSALDGLVSAGSAVVMPDITPVIYQSLFKERTIGTNVKIVGLHGEKVDPADQARINRGRTFPHVHQVRLLTGSHTNKTAYVLEGWVGRLIPKVTKAQAHVGNPPKSKAKKEDAPTPPKRASNADKRKPTTVKDLD